MGKSSSERGKAFRAKKKLDSLFVENEKLRHREKRANMSMQRKKRCKMQGKERLKRFRNALKPMSVTGTSQQFISAAYSAKSTKMKAVHR
jgi:hypothetical protein